MKASIRKWKESAYGNLAGIVVLWHYFGLRGLIVIAFNLARHRGARGWLHAAYPELAAKS